MRKIVIVSCLIGLAACNTPADRASQDCRDLNYTPGSAEYQHCQVDMKRAEKLDSENKAMLR